VDKEGLVWRDIEISPTKINGGNFKERASKQAKERALQLEPAYVEAI
jgi:hypothetical protein